MKYLLIPLSLLLSVCFIHAATTAENAHAELKSPSMKELRAHVQFIQNENFIKVTADVSGLKPSSVHGFHIHEKGKCKGPDFKSAGGHLNPEKLPHSGPAASLRHLGDLGNLVANEKGVARVEVVIPKHAAKDLASLVGKAVIIHSKADDMATQPAGNSGNRIACGIIETGNL